MIGMLFRFSLLGKIVIALVLVALLPLSLSSFQLLGLNRRAFADHVLRLHAVTARTTASRIDAMLSARHSVVKATAENPVLRIDPKGQAAQELLTGLLSSDGNLGIVSAGVFNAGGLEIIRAQQKALHQDVVGLLPKTETALPAITMRNDQLWMMIQTGLPETDATFRVLFEADSLKPLLDPEELGKSAKVILLDRQGQAVIPWEVGSVPAELLTQAQTGRVSGAGKFSDGTGREVLGAFAPTRHAPWSVVSWQPMHVAQAIEQNMKQRAFLALLVALALASILSIWAFFTVIRPLRRLVSDHRRLTGIDAANRGKDEITQLREAFEALERHITESKALDDVFLGRYQVIHRVGSGAMGTVFRGWDPKLKRPVALKTIRLEESPTRPEDAEVATQLLHEAISAARINHEHVISVYDVEDSEEFGFVAMEYVDGTTLAAYLKDDRILPEEEIVQLALAIARGLAAAHARDIVHRDIKPANILLGREGQIKIADFGISLLMSSLTGDTNRIFGTPGYLPPETLNGNGFSDLGDLFALGVLMYRAATGRRPFPGDDDRQVFINTLMMDPDPPRSLNHSISNELNDIIMNLLEKDPAQRIPSAERLIEALENLGADAHWVYAPAKEDWPDDETFSVSPSQLVDTLDFVMERDRRG